MKEAVDQWIRERRSTHPPHFDPERKIPDALIGELLETAVWAPTHGLTQPWAFRVFHGGGVGSFFRKLRDIYLTVTPPDMQKPGKADKFTEKAGLVSHVIAVCMIRDRNKRYPVVEEIVATGCVIENIYLCLQAYGIAGYLSTGDICYLRETKEFLGLGEEDLCLGFFQLGYAREGAHRPERKRIPAAEKTVWIG
jgi:nitroreductase